MKNFKRAVATICAATILTQTAVISAVSAPQKEEVVYVTMDSEGKTENISVVNIFPKGGVFDYGDYENVKILNSSIDFEQRGDLVTFDSDKDRLYYEGDLKNLSMPWDITIEYYLNDEKMSAEEIRGKAGDARIHLSVKENEDFDRDFYKNYALQISTKLSTADFKDIVSNEATMANEGEQKLLNFLSLPNSGLEADITFTTDDFYFDGFSINGVNLNLNVDLDKFGIDEKIDKLSNGVTDLNDGAKKLDDNSSELRTSTEKINDGIVKYVYGNKKLIEGVASIEEGFDGVDNALNAIVAKNDMLTNSSEQFYAALQKMGNMTIKIGNMPSEIVELSKASSDVKTALSTISKGTEDLSRGTSYGAYSKKLEENDINLKALETGNVALIKESAERIAALKSSLEKGEMKGSEKARAMAEIEYLQKTIGALKKNTEMLGGTKLYFDELNKGAKSIEGGVKKLDGGYVKIDGGIKTLASFAGEKNNDANEMAAKRVKEMTEKYAELNEGIKSYTGAVKSVQEGVSKISGGKDVLKSNIGELDKAGDMVLDGTKSLESGVKKYTEGVSKLHTGTEELYSKTKNIKGEVKDKINEEVGKNSDGEIESFASSKNENVKSVQFVIRTGEVKKLQKEKVVPEKIEEKAGFLEKLANLFK